MNPNTGHYPVSNFVVCTYRDQQTMFADNVWQLPPSSSSAGRLSSGKINFSVSLANGSNLTDEVNKEMLHACKCFVWAMWSPLNRDSNGAVSTVTTSWWKLRRVVRWMSRQHIARFSDLTQGDLDAFLSYVRGLGLSRPGIANSIGVLWRLFHAGPGVPNNLRMEPFGGRGPGDVADYVPRRDLKANKPIPDDLLPPLFMTAKRYVYEYSSSILAHLKEYEAAVGAGDSCLAAWKARRLAGKMRCVSTDGTEWRPPLKGNDLFEVERLLIASCYTLVAGFTGMRFSEVAALVPGCIRDPKTVEGEKWEVFCVNSITFKVEGGREGREREWVIGGRPVGSDFPIWGIEALRVMHRLHAIRGGASKLLFSAPMNRSGAGLAAQRTNAWLNDLAQVALPGTAHRVATHQFRRTFAKWCVRFDANAESALLQQFGHQHRGWLIGYVGRTPELEAVFSEERAEYVADMLMDMVTGPVAGADMVALKREKFELLATFKDTDDWVKLVTQLAKKKDIRLFHTGWGVCYFKKDAAACGGTTGPDLVARNPEVCTGCQNLRVLPRHQRFHEARIENARVMLESHPKQAEWLKEVWRRQIAQSEEILRQLSKEAA